MDTQQAYGRLIHTQTRTRTLIHTKLVRTFFNSTVCNIEYMLRSSYMYPSSLWSVGPFWLYAQLNRTQRYCCLILWPVLFSVNVIAATNIKPLSYKPLDARLRTSKELSTHAQNWTEHDENLWTQFGDTLQFRCWCFIFVCVCWNFINNFTIYWLASRFDESFHRSPSELSFKWNLSALTVILSLFLASPH